MASTVLAMARSRALVLEFIISFFLFSAFHFLIQRRQRPSPVADGVLFGSVQLCKAALPHHKKRVIAEAVLSVQAAGDGPLAGALAPQDVPLAENSADGTDEPNVIPWKNRHGISDHQPGIRIS